MSSSIARGKALPSLDGHLTLISAGTRNRWLYHSLTFPAQEAYARKWGISASFYVHPEDVGATWDRLRVWQEGLRHAKTGDWMWFMGPGCFIVNLDLDWRSLGPTEGDLIIGADERGLNFESFLLRSTRESILFLERVRKLFGTVATESEAMTVLIRAELIRADIRPKRQLASLVPPSAEIASDGGAQQNVYQSGDFILQLPPWEPKTINLLYNISKPHRGGAGAGAAKGGRVHRTHCIQALGDNLAHLHFLRKLAVSYPDHRFIHQCMPQHLPQLAEMIEDLGNISLEPMQRVDLGSIEAWKNAEFVWETHPLRNAYAEFYIEFFRYLARRMGLESPIEKPEDLLFDYPALKKPTALDAPFDFLIVNSMPLSGQFRDTTSMDGIIAALAARYTVIVTQPTPVPNVVCTQSHGQSVTGIGRLSTLCKYIVMISTGPSWTTFNIWNVDSIAFRLILIDPERIGLSKNTVQASTVAAAEIALKEAGLL